jgi:hypothetical protein
MFLRANQGQGASVQQAGITVEPLNQDGHDVKVIYDGLLAKSGAMQVYLHAGFGSTNQWEKTYDHRMERTQRGWEKTVNMENNLLNFCFKDSAENWDNNNGQNWTYAVAKQGKIQP